MAAKKLTVKQRRFIEEYAIDKKAKQAAIRAGYSKHTASAIGVENLTKPLIKEAIDKKLNELTEKAGIKVIDVLQGLKRIAEFDPRKLFDDTGKMKKIADLDDDTALAIASIDINEIRNMTEDKAISTITKKIKQSDRIKAWELIGKHLNMWIERKEIKHTGFETFAELMSELSKK